MKKTFVILTIVLAILAAPVFAEVTASGEVNFQFMTDFDDNYSEVVDSNDLIINLGGTVGEYTSISAEFEAEFADTDGDLTDGLDDGDATSRAVSMNAATVTQDITGALGIQAPVSLAVTFGIDGFSPEEYNDMAYGDFDKDGEVDPGTIMTKFSIGIMDMVTIDAAYFEEYKMGFNAYGTFADMVDVSVYFLKDFTTSAWDFSAIVPPDAEDPYAIGFNTGVTVMEGLKVGAGIEYGAWDTDADIENAMAYGLSVVYTGVEGLTVELGTNTTSYEDADDFAEQTSVKTGVAYALTDMFSVTGAFGVSALDAGDDEFEDVVLYEVGAKAAIDGMTYNVGYALGSDYEAAAGGFTDEDGDRVGNFYLKVGASF